MAKKTGAGADFAGAPLVRMEALVRAHFNSWFLARKRGLERKVKEKGRREKKAEGKGPGFGAM